MTIGEKILRIRKENRLSQEEFAGKLGVSRQAVSKWELNDAVPDLDKITLISRVFNVSTDSILLDSADMESPAGTCGKENSFEKTMKRVGKSTKKRLYIIGYVLIIYGAANLIFSSVLGIAWLAFSAELSEFLSRYNIGLSLDFLFWLFVFLAAAALVTLSLGIITAVILKKKSNNMRGQ